MAAGEVAPNPIIPKIIVLEFIDPELFVHEVEGPQYCHKKKSKHKHQSKILARTNPACAVNGPHRALKKKGRPRLQLAKLRRKTICATSTSLPPGGKKLVIN
ncbi:UNVERIFIED_CONTAM: hypothetical protein Slati_2935600 [Sesamum latifolium]|uniref:Uncharacterized protein n=1 Tax=Sesamum latifolium TaxID=2727402 RepID=A0AAW2VEP1_9LAMI